MQGDAEEAIETLQDGLSPDRLHSFVQADALVSRLDAYLKRMFA